MFSFRDKHYVFEHGKTFMVNPMEYGFRDNDCPLIADNKRLMAGTQKGTKQIEGPSGRGFNNPCLIVDCMAFFLCTNHFV